MKLLFQINTIKEYIREGQLEHAFKIVKELIASAIKSDESLSVILKKFENEIDVQLAFFNRIEDINRRSQISRDDYNIDINTINSSFLNTLNKIEERISKDSIFQIHLDQDSLTLDNGFQKEKIAETMLNSIEFIKKAKHFRVAGIGRQYIGQVKNIEIINSYYEAIEKRLSQNTPRDRFRYRRITIMELEDNFKQHLNKCFENCEQNDNQTEVILLEDIDMQFTYYIIDTSIVVINLYTYSRDNVLDCPYAYWSNDPDTIDLFINHFDRAWRRETHFGNIITSKDEFQEFIPFNESLLSGLREIKKYIKKLPNSSIRTAWAVNEINQTKDRLKGLVEYSLGIKNKITNGKLLTIFSYYVRRLNENDKYHTISFFEFWENITSEDTRDFYNANRSALIKGANITRIYIINNNNITLDKYIASQRVILEQHLKLAETYSNYKFKILFYPSDKYMRLLFEYKNFAIWYGQNETIVFKPEYVNSTGGSVYPKMTSLYYIDKNKVGHPSYIDNLEVLNNSEIDFNDIIKEQKSQSKLNEEQVFFLKSCGIEKYDKII
ncbi:MAG: hypothetical protein MI974_20945 [Chitinophagales bacterium]|nr:hypothetical protein [Chitinophagales bacterium]